MHERPRTQATSGISWWIIEEIIDKTTGEPIPINTVRFSFVKDNGEIMEYTAENLDSEQGFEIPVGFKTTLTVQAPGYEEWKQEFKFKEDGKYARGPIKMTTIGEPQG